MCHKDTENIEDTFLALEVPRVLNIRSNFLYQMKNCYPKFENLSRKSKMAAMLNLNKFEDTTSNSEFAKNCIMFMRQIIDLRSR